jgi:hypothetical protein
VRRLQEININANLICVVLRDDDDFLYGDSKSDPEHAVLTASGKAAFSYWSSVAGVGSNASSAVLLLYQYYLIYFNSFLPLRLCD